eukprot:Sdes_comp19462_c0_seq2m10895
MSIPTLCGYIGIAFGAGNALFFLTILNNSIGFLLFLLSGFFISAASLLSSFTWCLCPYMKPNYYWSTLIGVFYVELSRLLLYYISSLISPIMPLSTNYSKGVQRAYVSYSCGVGYGIFFGAIFFNFILETAKGPGMYLQQGCSNNISFGFVSAFIVNCILLLHVCWMVISFQALDLKMWNVYALVLVGHTLVALLSVVIEKKIGCEVSILCMYMVLFFYGYICFWLVLKRSKK